MFIFLFEVRLFCMSPHLNILFTSLMKQSYTINIRALFVSVTEFSELENLTSSSFVLYPVYF